MPLIKDIKTNLSKTLTQVEKLNLQIEKTISSTKTSIKNIKDVRLNLKELKVNNDKYNKAFEEFNLNSNQLSKKINKYLENPTPEKALKLKNQINVSNDYLTKATAFFSENETSSDKVINSFNKYKNNNPINDIKKLIKFTSILKPSFTKLINSVSKLKTKTKTKTQIKAQTRKVYFYNEATPNPTCDKKKRLLESDIFTRNLNYSYIILNYLKIITSKKLYKILEDKYDKQEADQRLELDVFNVILITQKPLVTDYKKAFEIVQKDNNNSILTILNLDLAEAIKINDKKKIKDTQDLIASNTKRINDNFNNFQEAVVNLGPISVKDTDRLYDDYIAKLDMVLNKNDKNEKELKVMRQKIMNLESDIAINRLRVKEANKAIADGEEYIKKYCPH
jgi:hypothetical protein